ncbi:MAG: hypothetical protein GTN59_00145 [Candidatus Dadabacteria bacterium]|nr:hypothetical protein [Candidatus Dadabacteria bacterium]
MDRNKKDGLSIWDCQDKQLSVTDTMKLTTGVGMEIMTLINEKLENGEANQTEAEKKRLHGQ